MAIVKRAVLFLVFLFCPSLASAYSWPFLVGNGTVGPHRITAAFGEFRNSDSSYPKGRLHGGQDMVPSTASSGNDAIGVTVYAIEPGTATKGDATFSGEILGNNSNSSLIGRKYN